MKEKRLLICTAGFPGSGKGIFTKAAKKLGIKIAVMGDYIRRIAKGKYGEATLHTTGKVMIELRKKYGKDVIAKLVYNDLSGWDERIILIDGLRNPEELEYFKKMNNDVILIWIFSSERNRFMRLIHRGRVDDVRQINDIVERELREREVGLAKLLFLADYYFINEYISEEEAIDKAKKLLSEFIERRST